MAVMGWLVFWSYKETPWGFFMEVHKRWLGKIFSKYQIRGGKGSSNLFLGQFMVWRRIISQGGISDVVSDSKE